MKTVLVTGASGFAGTHFINQYGNEYKILATYNTHPIQNAKALTLQIDLSNKQWVKQLLEKTKPDVILHLAGKAKSWGTSFEELFTLNVEVTKNLLDSVFELKNEQEYSPKIIIVSSAEVYGKTNNPRSIDENSPFFPTGDYGLTKVIVDRLSYVYATIKGLNITILRPFNHIGPNQSLGFFVSDMAAQIAKIEANQQQVLEVGNLNSIRDFLDVRDVVHAYKLAIEKETTSGEAFNISSGKGVSMQKILDKLISLSMSQIQIHTDESRMRPSDNPISI